MRTKPAGRVSSPARLNDVSRLTRAKTGSGQCEPLLATTTPEGLRRLSEKEPSLAREFTALDIAEPSVEVPDLFAPVTEASPNFAELEPYVTKVIELLLTEKKMPLVNVNLPDKPKGIRWTRQSVREYDGKVVPSKDPMGRAIFWFTVIPLEPAEEGTDRWAVEHNWVSITPLRLDLTDEKDLARALSLSQSLPVSAKKH